jgi:ABC-type antimicrobial peptide transport system permease subunit
MQPGESAISPTQSAVSPGYFETLGMRLVEGRAFDARDGADGPPVIIVDDQLARRFFPDGRAVGRRMWRPDSNEALTNPDKAPHYDIVGVVGSIRMRGLTSQQDAMGAYYFPMAQSPRRGLDFVVRGATGTALVEPIRKVIAGLDPELALFDVRGMTERIEGSLTDRRTPMMLVAGFGGIALLLAAVGTYGMLAHVAELRTPEIGIRVALGSDTTGIFRLVLRDGQSVTIVGLALGLAGAAGLARFIESQLYGVSPLDPGVFVLAVALLGAVAAVACIIPARRATRIDPAGALTK